MSGAKRKGSLQYGQFDASNNVKTRIHQQSGLPLTVLNLDFVV